MILLIVKKKIRTWLKAQREKYGKFRYIFIPELHKNGRLHFHGVTGGFSPKLTKARNTKTGRLIKKNGKQVYNVDSYQLGFSTIKKIDSSEKVANYITKYITKDLLAIPSGYKQPKYFSSRGLIKPIVSYENLERNYFEGLIPSVSLGHLDNLEYKEDIAEVSFQKLTEGVMDFMNEYAFSNFVLTIKSAGFISNKLINSQMTLDFAYTLYLLLHADPNIDNSKIKHYVAKWYVMTTLTSRYITSPESVMDTDIRRIKERGFVAYFEEVEAANLSETF